MAIVTLKVSKETVSVLENFLWVFDIKPDKCFWSTSSSGMSIYNTEDDRTLILSVEEEA